MDPGKISPKVSPSVTMSFLKMVSGDAVSTIFLQPTAQSDFLSAVSTSRVVRRPAKFGAEEIEKLEGLEQQL